MIYAADKTCQAERRAVNIYKMAAQQVVASARDQGRAPS